MNYYNNFVNVNKLSASQFVKLKKDFTNAVTMFFVFNSETVANLSVGRCLFERMIDAKLAYHTPIHVLAMLDFASMNDIKLEPWEELAILFHDAIYEPKYHDNEACSAMFMRALCKPFLSELLIFEAEYAILATAHHQNKDTPDKYHKILDLDLCNFAMENSKFNVTSNLIKLEYDCPDEKWEKKRKEFLTKLNEKGYIYRTQFFKEKFESVAQQNIALTLL